MCRINIEWSICVSTFHFDLFVFQAVMKALVEDKLPSLSNHLEVNGIDVTVVSFNWFITLFIDALPTEASDNCNIFYDSFIAHSLHSQC